jgi:hypothetical protein
MRLELTSFCVARSWHSKRLQQALESLSAHSDPQKSPKLLANPVKVSAA